MDLRFLALAALLPVCLPSFSDAGERPTCNKDTCDPRPDILPYSLTSWHQDYRQIYNRPRYWSGRIAACIEPTSQEAMTWCEANQAGLYNGPQHGRENPPVYKRYCYPKPWEILQTGPRPDFPKAKGAYALGQSNSTAEPTSKTQEPSMKNPDSSSRNSSENKSGNTKPEDTKLNDAKAVEDSGAEAAQQNEVEKQASAANAKVYRASTIRLDLN